MGARKLFSECKVIAISGASYGKGTLLVLPGSAA